MTPLASVSALEARLGLAPGSLAGADLARASAVLEDASALVRAEAGVDWLDAGPPETVTAPAEVVTVTLQAALRAYRNPENFVSESLGDYSYRLADNAQTGLFLTEEERRLIRRAAGVSAVGVWSVYTPSAYGDPRLNPGSSWEVPLP